MQARTELHTVYNTLRTQGKVGLFVPLQMLHNGGFPRESFKKRIEEFITIKKNKRFAIAIEISMENKWQ